MDARLKKGSVSLFRLIP